MIERIEINLLPAEYRIRKRSLKISRAVIYPALTFLVMLIAGALYSMHLKDKEEGLKNDIETITKEIQANRHIQAEMNKLREEKKITDEKIRALERISVDRGKWVRLLEILSGNLPAYAWLVSVKEEGAARLAIEARSYSFPEVAQYMTKLEDTEYVSGVELTGIEQVAGQDRSVFRFTLICTLNADVGLGPSAVADDASGMAAGAAAGDSSAAAPRAGRAPRGGR
jgi:Tfp pilus assembly protein PilN